MNTDSAVWFIAGLMVGFISMRAVGWLCICGLLVAVGSGSAYAIETINWSVHNGTGSSISWTIYENAGGTWYSLGISGTTAAGATSSGSSTACSADGCLTWAAWANPGPPSGQECVDPSTHCFNCSGTESCSFNFGAVAPPTYQFNGACITNNSTGIVGFYAHLSSSFTNGPQDYYSGPLPPNGSWCMPAVTNGQPFTLEWQKVYYNNDGGTNALDTFLPIQAGTNAPPGVQGGNGGAGPPNGSNPIQGAPSGAGSNTNLTGGQYQFGVSNMVSVIYDIGQGQMALLRMIIQQNGSNSPAQANLQTNINYKGDFQNLTNLGIANTNWLSLLNSNIARLGSLTDTNYYGSNFTAWSNSAFADAMALSNMLWAAGITGYLGAAQMTGYANLQAGDLSLWDIPVAQRDLSPYGTNGNYYHLSPVATNLWTEITPWVRLFFTFFMVTVSIWAIQARVAESLRLVELTPGCGPLKAGFAGVFGWVMSIGVTAVAIAALPVLLSAAISTVYSFSGGAPFSPFGDAGIASAGGFASSVRLGLNILSYLFPFSLAMGLILYLTLFHFIADATVLFAMRLVRRMS